MFFWAIGAFTLIVGAFFVWLLKDGLGPNAADSVGLAALIRFGRGMAEIAVFYLVPLLVGCVIYPWRRKAV
jgi:hypothetical protein